MRTWPYVPVALRFSFTVATTAFAGTEQPMPRPQSAAKKAKVIPSHFSFNPRSSAYIAPPSIVPSWLFTRYFRAITVSAYLVAIPKTPVNQIQRTAPGPPSAMAVPTPMMFAVPTVEARAVVSAPNCETSPGASGSLVTESFMALKMSFCTKPVLKVIKRCVPSKRIICGQPHKILSNCSIIVAAFISSLVYRIRAKGTLVKNRASAL